MASDCVTGVSPTTNVGTCRNVFIWMYSAEFCSPYSPGARTQTRRRSYARAVDVRQTMERFTHPVTDQVDRHLLDGI